MWMDNSQKHPTNFPRSVFRLGALGNGPWESVRAKVFEVGAGGTGFHPEDPEIPVVKDLDKHGEKKPPFTSQRPTFSQFWGLIRMVARVTFHKN